MKKRVRVETVNEVNKFVADAVRELCAKYNVKKPLVAITRFGSRYFPYEEGRLVVNNRVYAAWEIDKEKAKKVIRWIVAHEFNHHLQYLRGTIPPLSEIFSGLLEVVEAISPKIEAEANKFTEAYTGVSYSEYSATVVELFKTVEKEYVKRLPELEATEV
jgi:predicted SprT family Zn-dependent metalloprotease